MRQNGLQRGFRGNFRQYAHCGGRLRPDVVWFGEMLPEKELEKAFQVSRQCDLFFAVGSSGIVQPAASLPITARTQGAFVVEINVEPTDLTYIVDEHLNGKSGEIMPAIVNKIKELRGNK